MCVQVMNVAVTIDGVKPMTCCSRLTSNGIIKLTTLYSNQNHLNSNRNSSSSSSDSNIDSDSTRPLDSLVSGVDYDCIECCSDTDFQNISPTTKCGLLKAVLVVLNVVKPMSLNHHQHTSTTMLSLSDLTERLLSAYGGGIDIACTSSLPAGSGMGGSSILAAAVLKSVSGLLGLSCEESDLVYLVSQVEQVMTTGGGWQDQIGAIYGGFKIGRSECGLPLQVTVQTVELPEVLRRALESRLVVVYTGQQRLAKDTLIRALRTFAITASGNSNHTIGSKIVEHSLFETVDALVQGAEAGFSRLETSIAAIAAQKTRSTTYSLDVSDASSSEDVVIDGIVDKAIIDLAGTLNRYTRALFIVCIVIDMSYQHELQVSHSSVVAYSIAALQYVSVDVSCIHVGS